ncbi:MBL fold metallo-hydrolase [Lacrimispora saccharolytica]|uniref:Flavodoxin/nitric oxide synthase n=1 Tax=Lacrimispora saccharolytica (strain ATCC 35040 / DSM 2544 / NRCC 2533 / WM1) TaxID=610130 RepID=D9R0R8_LACSW|nr:MBL fold metallo-hydrolase [Lacrimispora saccharolytica]ADL02717.1 flavodoxin/nitric oxide synthase [[Clostridium] saccharolyticum WM1]QRV19065.1 MBL fold metallo-hydrolase [Lacrimispora saccharolytica]
MKKLVKNNVYWVGFMDWELESFHGADYSINHGSSQNAYLIKEEKTVLIDTVWRPHSTEFMDNLEREIDLKEIDFIVANHGEVDHSGSLPALMEKIPGTPIYCTANGVKSLTGQYHHPEWNYQVVKTGDSIDIGNGKKLVFVEMKMLHWPDSMATYLTGDNILFSNDAFGQHYAVEELFNDKADQCRLWEEAIKYYANILTPFSPLVKKKIEEIQGLNLPIDIIATSHGSIWRENPLQIVEKYYEWSQNYQEDQITIVYDTMWDGTKQLAHKISAEIARISPDTRVKIYNISKTNKNDIMTEVFKSKAIALGSPTVGGSILSSVGGWLDFLKELKYKGKKAAVFGCYGWSGEGNKVLRERLTEAGFSVVEAEAKCLWNPEEEDFNKAADIAGALCQKES